LDLGRTGRLAVSSSYPISFLSFSFLAEFSKRLRISREIIPSFLFHKSNFVGSDVFNEMSVCHNTISRLFAESLQFSLSSHFAGSSQFAGSLPLSDQSANNISSSTVSILVSVLLGLVALIVLIAILLILFLRRSSTTTEESDGTEVTSETPTASFDTTCAEVFDEHDFINPLDDAAMVSSVGQEDAWPDQQDELVIDSL
jgi:hypothetical protein